MKSRGLSTEGSLGKVGFQIAGTRKHTVKIYGKQRDVIVMTAKIMLKDGKTIEWSVVADMVDGTAKPALEAFGAACKSLHENSKDAKAAKKLIRSGFNFSIKENDVKKGQDKGSTVYLLRESSHAPGKLEWWCNREQGKGKVTLDESELELLKNIHRSMMRQLDVNQRKGGGSPIARLVEEE